MAINFFAHEKENLQKYIQIVASYWEQHVEVCDWQILIILTFWMVKGNFEAEFYRHFKVIVKHFNEETIFFLN